MSDLDAIRARALAMTRDGKRWPVYQGGHLVGTLPDLPSRSLSAMYDLRPGDFRWGERDGERIIIADGTLGPGDLQCVPFFQLPDGTEAGPGAEAMTLDDLLDKGLSRFEALDTTIKRALK